MWCTYTDPELAQVGLSQEEAEDPIRSLLHVNLDEPFGFPVEDRSIDVVELHLNRLDRNPPCLGATIGAGRELIAGPVSPGSAAPPRRNARRVYDARMF